jgi:hypothetical protein
MSINSGFQQQRPLAWSAAVRSAPSQRSGSRMTPAAKPPVAPEEKSLSPKLER